MAAADVVIVSLTEIVRYSRYVHCLAQNLPQHAYTAAIHLLEAAMAVTSSLVALMRYQIILQKRKQDYMLCHLHTSITRSLVLPAKERC